MYMLEINQQRCVLCGNCEIHLPELQGAVGSAAGELLISNDNYSKHFNEIQAAIDSCYLDALALKVLP